MATVEGRIRFKCPAGQWIRARDEWQRQVAHATTTAVREAGIKARDAGRAAMAGGGFGTLWQKSLVSVMHPKSGEVLNPWAWVHMKKNFASVFEEGATIQGNPLLWIPLPVVPKYPGDATRQMTPKIYREKVGPLVSIKRPGKAPMLGGYLSVPTSGNISRSSFSKVSGGFLGFGKNAKFGKAASKRKPQVVPLFVGVPTAKIESMFDATGAMERVANSGILGELYEEHINDLRGR